MIGFVVDKSKNNTYKSKNNTIQFYPFMKTQTFLLKSSL